MREAVVLRRDAHPAGAQVVHRMVDAAVPELELEALAAEREPEDLVPETDAEDRHAADEARAPLSIP